MGGWPSSGRRTSNGQVQSRPVHARPSTQAVPRPSVAPVRFENHDVTELVRTCDLRHGTQPSTSGRRLPHRARQTISGSSGYGAAYTSPPAPRFPPRRRDMSRAVDAARNDNEGGIGATVTEAGTGLPGPSASSAAPAAGGGRAAGVLGRLDPGPQVSPAARPARAWRPLRRFSVTAPLPQGAIRRVPSRHRRLGMRRHGTEYGAALGSRRRADMAAPPGVPRDPRGDRRPTYGPPCRWRDAEGFRFTKAPSPVISSSRQLEIAGLLRFVRRGFARRSGRPCGGPTLAPPSVRGRRDRDAGTRQGCSAVSFGRFGLVKHATTGAVMFRGPLGASSPSSSSRSIASTRSCTYNSCPGHGGGATAATFVEVHRAPLSPCAAGAHRHR